MLKPARKAVETSGRIDPGSVTVGRKGKRVKRAAAPTFGVHVHVDRSAIVKRSAEAQRAIVRQRLLAGF